MCVPCSVGMMEKDERREFGFPITNQKQMRERGDVCIDYMGIEMRERGDHTNNTIRKGHLG